jgi:hypothetical protein
VAGRRDQPFHSATAMAAGNERRFGRTRPWPAEKIVVFISHARFEHFPV